MTPVEMEKNRCILTLVQTGGSQSWRYHPSGAVGKIKEGEVMEKGITGIRTK